VKKHSENSGFFDSVKTSEKEITETLSTEVIVIGAGVVGATVAEAFRKRGMEVWVLDDDDPEGGSRPCGGLIKPSPLMGLPDVDIRESLDILESCFGLTKEVMTIRPSGNLIKAGIFGVMMDHVFKIEKTVGHVWGYETAPNKVFFTPLGEVKSVEIKCKILVIAAGVRTKKLVPEAFVKDDLIAKRGFSFHFAGQVQEPFVKFWAPYKQITVHNTVYHGEEIVWAGDGSALTLPSWYEGRIKEAYKRVTDEMEPGHEYIRTLRGLRSFVRNKKYKPCFLKEIDPHCWIATGSGKFGLISGGYSAKEIIKKELR
jgi:glycine/D-amino acid oxidase-like deaminating enzyme